MKSIMLWVVTQVNFYQDNVKSQKRALLIRHVDDGHFSSKKNTKGF
jgi:hypothetical protein